MEHTPELNKALSELKKVTGISLDVHTDSPQEQEFALTQIHSLSLAYKEKYSKNHFLQSLMTEGIPSYDILKRASNLHIDPEIPRVLFLAETIKLLDDTVLQVLKNLFPSQSKTYLVSMSEKSIAILRPLKVSETDEHMDHLSHTIVDTLNMEALAHVKVAYSGNISTLSELPGAFRETSLALQVGKLFYSGQTVFPYNRLGVGRLIYRLPSGICENFLKEIFGSGTPEPFDGETTAAINKFFQNNLNIAETSRQLHMHRNTLIYRLEQIEKKTGLDIRKFEDAMTLKIAIMVINYLQTERNS
ncbi:PucR family transcriptional regulator [Clostridium sp. C105KSO13]|uniref:PucR family transcriptional regulator n=1 Tax=Clostridium sp. C105KSO13 TaxID=1776045 RepID=UPI0007406C8B|nr:helix-turn-helix domain-containing protein [Clostridium sp. C105KSO13]CUX40956.1 Purine catabolism regulatory protein [Clostridium sp. C105KSO13]